MSLLETPERHAANPPGTWIVEKAGPRCWRLKAADGAPIDTYRTQREALQNRERGPWVTIYEREGRWYAGDTPAGWKPYAQIVAERERNEQAQALFRAFGAAGYERARIEEPGKLCCGGREELPEGRPAWASPDGWLWCREHLASLLSEPANA